MTSFKHSTNASVPPVEEPIKIILSNGTSLEGVKGSIISAVFFDIL